MDRWQVFIGEYLQGTVIADDERSAIRRMCDEAGYDTPDEMAREYEGHTEADVRAVCIDG